MTDGAAGVSVIDRLILSGIDGDTIHESDSDSDDSDHEVKEQQQTQHHHDREGIAVQENQNGRPKYAPIEQEL